ncbi:MAG: hypothetical protein ACUVRO_07075, partial [Armatimonadota bacterium]
PVCVLAAEIHTGYRVHDGLQESMEGWWQIDDRPAGRGVSRRRPEGAVAVCRDEAGACLVNPKAGTCSTALAG